MASNPTVGLNQETPQVQISQRELLELGILEGQLARFSAACVERRQYFGALLGAGAAIEPGEYALAPNGTLVLA